MNQDTTAASTVSPEGRSTKDKFRSFVPEYIEELVSEHAQNRNYKGISIAICVILLVVGCVALSVFLLMPDVQHPVIPRVSKSDIFDGPWRLPDHQWVGSDLVYRSREGDVIRISPTGDNQEILIENVFLESYGIKKCTISNDGKFALLVYNKAQIHKYSFNASYYIYNIQERAKTLLDHEGEDTIFQFAGFGRRGNSLLYILNGDIYYKTSVDASPTRLTRDGMLGIIHNGMADWIYEEEILKSSTAHWFSPSGRYLAYASFDDSVVDDTHVTTYNSEKPYKVVDKFKYPKAGRLNPVVNVRVIDLDTLETRNITKSTLHGGTLDTFHSLTWVSDDELLITWSNRTLTASVMFLCFRTMDTCRGDVIDRYTRNERSNSKSGWLSYLDQRPILSDDPHIFFYILPSDHGGQSEFHHLARVDRGKKPSDITFLTEGNWEVMKILHYDATKKEVYYISNQRHRGSRHVYKVNMQRQKTCLTCAVNGINSAIFNGSEYTIDAREISENLTCNAANKCKYYDASFGPNSDIFVAKCLGPCLPYAGVVRLPFGAKSREEDENSEVTMQILVPPTHHLPNLLIPITRYPRIMKDGYEINVKILLPASIHVGKRPVVFFKNDLGTQTADFRFSLDLATYIVTNIGVVGVFVDGRGSSGNGVRLLNSVAGRPGVLEIEDMKAVLAYLKPNVNVDVTKVGVFGYSGYGGYTASLSLTSPEFTCAVARSPVTDWKIFDSFGSERILDLPLDNPVLYSKTRLIHLIEGVSEKSKLMVFHGMQDKRVSMQHSVLLEQAVMLSSLPLESVKVTFHPSVEAGSNSLESKKLESNIYESISLFLRNCLFGSSDMGKAQIELLESNYGIPYRK